MITKRLALFLLLGACIAVSTIPAWGQASQMQVDLSSVFNVTGIYTDGSTFSAGLDGGGAAYSENSMVATPCALSGCSAPSYPTLSLPAGSNTIVFKFGPANSPNTVSGGAGGAGGGPIPLPQSQFTTLQMLGTGVQGGQQGNVVITYSDGSNTTVSQGFSDWFSGGPYNTGESAVLPLPYRINGNGTQDNRTFRIYAYDLVLDPSKTVQSLTLPNNRNIVILAATLVAVPGYATSAGIPTPAAIKVGSSASVPATVTSEAGYSGTVTLGCNITPDIAKLNNSAATPPSCSFSPSTVTISPGNPGTSTMTFSTSAPGKTSAFVRPSHFYYALWLPVPALALMGLWSGNSRRQKAVSMLLLWMLLGTLALAPGCVTYSHLGSVGTPPGAYTIAVTGTDANKVTQFGSGGTVTVTVQ